MDTKTEHDVLGMTMSPFPPVVEGCSSGKKSSRKGVFTLGRLAKYGPDAVGSGDVQ